MKRTKSYIVGHFFDHPDISGFPSSKIPDHGPTDRNPAITIYSGVVQALAGFWSGYLFTVWTFILKRLNIDQIQFSTSSV